MQKDELKSLVTRMCQELMDKIDSSDYAITQEVIAFLQDASETIDSIKDDNSFSIEQAEFKFTSIYKDIANRSISEYQESNGRFEELTKLHEDTLKECPYIHLNLPDISARFNDIQTHMVNEVTRANSVISRLTNKIKELENSSNLDSLTKVLNRRALTAYLDNLCSKQDVNQELYMLIIDIDDFKSINDSYGHIAGDKILIFIANIFRKTLRDGDKIFRYGGEEFVIILNRLDFTACMEIASRILNLVSNNKLVYKGESLHVTVSIGVTSYQKNDTPDSIIHRADKALYQSKATGKNRISTEFTKDGD